MHLGSKKEYQNYNRIQPELLQPIKRIKYVDNSIGVDLWNCYEVSALRNDGYPVVGILRFYYDSNSEYIIESKSLKLYLNSYNMVKCGSIDKEVIEYIEQHVSDDLTRTLKTVVFCRLHYIPELMFSSKPIIYDPPGVKNSTQLYSYTSPILRSNCKVTNQPDWADVIIYSNGFLTKKSIDEHIISYRDQQHFHEEVCEKIFKFIHYNYSRSETYVQCLYTRRGGIDITPTRASSLSMYYLCAAINLETLQAKTIRQ